MLIIPHDLLSQNSCSRAAIIQAINEKKSISEVCNLELLESIDVSEANQIINEGMQALSSAPVSAQSNVNYLQFFIELAKLHQINDSLHAALHYDLGKLAFNKLDDYKTAIASFDSAYSLASKLSPVDSIFLAGCRSNQASSHYYAGNYYHADAIIKQLFDQGWPLKLTSQGRNYRIQGEIKKAEGNVPLAEQYYKLSGNKFLQHFRDSAYYAMYGLNEIGLLYYDYYQYEKALSIYSRALVMLNRSPDEAEANKYWIRDININMANANIRLNNYAVAISIYQNLLKEYDFENHPGSHTQLSLNLAACFLDQDSLSAAAAVMNALDSLLPRSSQHTTRSLLDYNRAKLWRKRGSFDLALPFYKSELNACCQMDLADLLSLDLSNPGSIDWQRISSLARKMAVTYRDRYIEQRNSVDLDTARYLYQLDQSLMDWLKLKQFEPGFTVDLGAMNADLLDEILALHQIAPWTDETLYMFFEKSKSSALLASLNNAKAEEHFFSKFSAIKEVRDLKSEIDLIEREINSTRDEQTRLKLQSELAEISEKLVDATVQKRALFQNQKQLHELYRTISLDELRQNMENNQVILSYFIGEENLYTLLITANEIKLFHREIPSTFEDDIQTVTGFNRGLLKDRKAWIASNRRLANLLLDAVLPYVTDRVMIVPDGVLSYLPFEILLLPEEGNGSDFRQLPYFLRSAVISYNFSCSIWNEMREKRTSNDGFVAMAPTFDLESSDDTVSTAALPLAFAKKEVEAISQIWKINSTNSLITKSDFVDAAQSARMIHFAGHALLDDHIADNSYLAFSSRRAIEDRLFIGEIYNLNLSSDLVTLSACNTGQGELKKGEGAISLARAFAYAGTKSMVYSLWDVNDAATRKIMEVFYQELKDGTKKDKALQLAKLDYLDHALETTAQPQFWAGFVAMGDMVTLNSQLPPWILILIVISGVTLFGFIYQMNKKRQT